MNALEMFSKLGYKVLFKNRGGIAYIKAKEKKVICFTDAEVRSYYDNDQKSFTDYEDCAEVTPAEINAISKQLEELGWFD